MSELAANAATMVRLSWRADPWRSVGALVTTVLVPLTGSLRAVGLALIADGVVRGDRSQATTGVVVVAGLIGAYHLLEWANAALRMRLREQSILYLDQRVMALVAGLPGLEHHERPDYQDRMELLRRSRGSLVNPFMPIPWTLASIVQLIVTVAILGHLHPLLWLLPVAAVPSVLGTASVERGWRRLWEEQAEDQRLLTHLYELATLPDAGKEVRLFALADELRTRHAATFWRLERRRRAMSVRAAALQASGWAIFAVAYMAATILVVHRAVAGQLSVGSAVLVLTLGSQVNGQVSELVFLTSWFHRTVEAISHYRWLEARADEATATAAARPTEAVPDQLTAGITLSGVGFTYPATDHVVLDGIDVHLPAGAVVAVVGDNGAGKTTLIKLLLRFYEPTTGTISVDGADLCCIDPDSWRARTSGSFQDFARLLLVARRSVGVGRLRHLDDEAEVLAALARGGGADLVDRLPQRLATQLGPEFEGGVQLSVGQWQKVALSRAMMRPEPLLLVLDEPTASLDSTTEHALFERYADQARRAGSNAGAITLLVSHRFSTVRMADLILVVAGGRVAEAGTHQQLLGLSGLYAELYTLQARSYA